jgi:hypothetical protein
MNTLKTWYSKNTKSIWLIAGIVVVVLLGIVFAGDGGLLLGTAGSGCDFSSIPQNTDQAKWGMVIVGNGMFLRASSDAKSAEVGKLPQCTIFEIKGRNTDAQWLAIKVQGKTLEGWVSNGQDWTGKWLYYNTDLATIPVSNTTYAAPSGGGSSSGGSSGSGYGGPIEDNYFIIGNGKVSSGKITGLPASQPYNVTLAPEKQPQKAVVIWQGTTGSDGTTSFQAPFPYTWSDGSQIKSGNLTLVIYVSGAAQRTISLAYSSK